MKRMISIILVFVLAGSLAACGAAKPKEQTDKLQVVTTIFPQYDFVRQIAGDKVDLTMLLSPGAESHSYDPSPKDIITIQNCDIFIYVGGESESWVDRILDSMDTSGMKIISLMELVDVVEEEYVDGMQEDDHDDEDDDDEIEYDEHVWTSPKNAAKIVKQLCDALVSAEEKAENGAAYKENADAYIAEIDLLDADFEALMAQRARDTLVFGDRFPFRYFADAYNLKYYAAFPGCSTETEASASTVAFLIDKVKDEAIPVVFHIEFSNEKMADTICEDGGAKKLQLHSCHNLTKTDFDGGATYVSLMRQNLENLKEALL